ncbi:MAG: hypothetical protein KDD37_00835 [Bdellovibrionales bacterium]|nr:hypothetical protein [Bdellovibrionales bacterium]
MKRILLIISSILFFSVAQASQSSDDITAILQDARVIHLMGDAEIRNITNLNGRRYELAFGNCIVHIRVSSICAPMPGGPCATEISWDSGSVSCLP